MPGLPTLIIGVGGTGLKVLQRVKERLTETYHGEVPNTIMLLDFDTALQSPEDNFCGVRLTEDSRTQSGARVAEMQLIQTPKVYTVDNVIQEAREGHPRWNWLQVDREADRLDRVLRPAEKVIVDGAGAFRQLGRMAFFHNYQAVESTLQAAMYTIINERDQELSDLAQREGVANTAAAKRNVFIVGSLAGGTGSGALLDLAVMIRRLKERNPGFSDIVLIGMIAMPRIFGNLRDEKGRRIPNTYAALRELDRFQRAHGPETAYRMVAGTNEDMTISKILFDLCYLVDIQDTNGNQPGNGQANLGVLPTMADMIVAHTDLKLGLRLNAANINVNANYVMPVNNENAWNAGNGNHYAYQSPRVYSALNTHSVIFPREDVAKSLSLRFLLDLIDTHLIARERRSSDLAVPDVPVRPDWLVEILGKDNPTAQEKSSIELTASHGDLDLGIFVRTLIQSSNDPSRRFSTDQDDVLRWLVEDGVRRTGVADILKKSIASASAPVEEARDMNQYRNRVVRWLDQHLGYLIDSNNPLGDRAGGEWDNHCGSLINDMRPAMESRIDDLVLRILNQRVEVGEGQDKTSLLRANRPAYALAVLRALKERVRIFLRQTERSFGETARNVIEQRKTLEDHRALVENFKPGLPLFTRNPGPEYLKALRQVAESEREKLLRNLVTHMAEEFGGDITREGRPQSVLDRAIGELETWVATLTSVRERIAQEHSRHQDRRHEKYKIDVRSYITDPQRFPQHAAQVEEGLYARHKPAVWRTLLGPDPSGAGSAGFFWETNPATQHYFDYVITTKEKRFRLNPRHEPQVKPMLGVGQGVDGIAAAWAEGAFRLLAERVRGDKEARVGTYMRMVYDSPGDFLGRVIGKTHSPLVELNRVTMNPGQLEQYLAMDSTSDDPRVTEFFSWFGQGKGFWGGPNKMAVEAESDVACMFVALYHGLELDHISGFTSCNQPYSAMNTQQGLLHLFPEERYAAHYETQIPSLRNDTWREVTRLHPEIVLCLNNPRHVRGFAVAFISGMLRLGPVHNSQGTVQEMVLEVPGGEPIQLSDSTNNRIDRYHLMRPQDRLAARLLQAFQTFMLRGHAINDRYAAVPFEAIIAPGQAWFNEQYSDANPEKLLKAWETQAEAPSLQPLFAAESRDPRFRDLGLVLLLELRAWLKERS